MANLSQKEIDELLKFFDKPYELDDTFCGDSLAGFHVYRDYIGFTEKYRYCIHCNKKVYK